MQKSVEVYIGSIMVGLECGGRNGKSRTESVWLRILLQNIEKIVEMGEKEICEARVELSASFREKLLIDRFFVPSVLIRPSVCKGVEHIADRGNACIEADLFTGESLRIALSVVAFVMLMGDRIGDPKELTLHGTENAVADLRMAFHRKVLLLRQFVRFVEDRILNADLAEVVKRRSKAK